MKLYGYWRSSAAYRVRIGLNLKNIPCEHISVHLVKDGGEQYRTDYQEKNPQSLVPTLELDDGTHLSQSLAILEYLEEMYPDPALFPNDPVLKARVRAFAQSIACDIHPLNNLRVLQYLSGVLNVTDDQKTLWYKHWIETGFKAAEKTLAKTSNGTFCFGDSPTLADACLIPQVYNAHRFDVDMTPFPMINKINTHCLSLEAFSKASPERQEDAS